MKIEGKYAINAPQEKVWALLLDPRAIAKCIPGCQGLEPAGPNRYQATIRIGFAAMQGTFRRRSGCWTPGPATSTACTWKGRADPVL